jgi:hypothetical protein
LIIIPLTDEDKNGNDYKISERDLSLHPDDFSSKVMVDILT